MLKRIGMLVVGAALALAPATAFARDHGDHGRGFSSGGRNSGGHEERGRSEHFRGEAREHDRDRGHFGFGFGYAPPVYAPYGYGYGYGYNYDPNSCGYYDQWGNWYSSGNCYAYPYGY